MQQKTNLNITPVLALHWASKEWHRWLDIPQAVFNGAPNAVDYVAGIHQRILLFVFAPSRDIVLLVSRVLIAP